MEKKIRYCCDKWDENWDESIDSDNAMLKTEYEKQEYCQFCGKKIRERKRKIDSIWVDLERPNAYCGDPEYGYRISLKELKKALEEV